MWSAGPVRVYLGTFGGVGGGTVRIFYFPLLCFGGFGTIEMVGVAGQYGFSSFPGPVLAGTVRLKWRGCAVISFFIFLSLLSILLAGGYAR